MKVGDLVKWVMPGGLPVTEHTGGIIVDGPREGFQGTERRESYQVHWFAHDETSWHGGHNLELTSESPKKVFQTKV